MIDMKEIYEVPQLQIIEIEATVAMMNNGSRGEGYGEEIPLGFEMPIGF